MATTLPAQPVVNVPSEPSCSQCSIEVTGQRRLQFPDKLPLASAPQAVRKAARGRIWVMSQSDVYQFDSSGRFTAVIGRAGRGPGEYSGPSEAVALPGDSTLVVDVGNARATIVDANNKVARTVALTGQLGFAVVLRWPDSVLMTGAVGSPGAAGWPLHLVSFQDSPSRIVRSFGAGSGDLQPNQAASVGYLLAPLKSGGFASADRDAYQLHLWNSRGELTRSITRQADWFEGKAPRYMGSPKVPPQPGTSGLWMDDEGLAWVLTRVAAPGWKSAWDNTPRSRELRVSSVAIERLYDSILEVIDPRSGRVVARRNLPGWVIAILPGGELVTYTTDMVGEPQLFIQSARLVRK